MGNGKCDDGESKGIGIVARDDVEAESDDKKVLNKFNLLTNSI